MQYVENIFGREEIEPLENSPGIDFVRNGNGKGYRGVVKRDGQDYGSDGHDSDGRTPGDPGLPRGGSVSAAGGAQMSDDGNTWIDSGSDDGTTPGDPRVALGTVRGQNIKRFRPGTEGSGGTFDPGTYDPQYGSPQTYICPACGYEIDAETAEASQKILPLATPTMNSAIDSAMKKQAGRGRGRLAGGNLYPDSGQGRDDDFSDMGDDGNAGGGARLTDRVSPVDCPRCGVSFQPANDGATY
jgi:hypothetical protein